MRNDTRRIAVSQNGNDGFSCEDLEEVLMNKPEQILIQALEQIASADLAEPCASTALGALEQYYAALNDQGDPGDEA